MSLKNYYELLGVEPDSSLSQIKSAFRRKAKAFHPDVDPSGRHTAKMRLLLNAYKVLSNPEKRKQYDLLNAGKISRFRFNYRDHLREREDEESKAKLIFFDLLHRHEKDALELFDDLTSKNGFSLEKHLNREDYMDCVFMLAEEYEKRGEYEKAFDLYVRIVHYELEEPYFKHFFREVVDRLRLLSCFKMPGAVESEKLVEYLRELVGFNFSSKDTAFFLKKIAEIYAEENDFEVAFRYLEEGLKLHDKLPGIKKLRDKLAYAAR